MGHETDFTIADFVADVRAPTPSAAAELVSNDISSIQEVLEQNVYRLNKFVTEYFVDKYNDLDNISLIMQKNANAFLVDKSQNVQALASKFLRLATIKFNDTLHDFDKLTSSLEANNPINILKKGYSQVTTTSGQVLNNAKTIKIGEQIKVKLYNGKLLCEVKDKEE